MIIKLLELRDEGTRIAVMAISVTPENEQQRALIRSAGYSPSFDDVMMIDLHSCNGSYDPYKHGGARTRREAHLYIREHFSELKDGDVVDVEFILGERDTPKVSEIQAIY